MNCAISKPLILFVTVNSLCFLVYFTSFNILNISVPVSTFDTTFTSLSTLKTETLTLTADKDYVLSDNKSLVFVGDIMLARHVEHLMSVNGYNYPFLDSNFLISEPAYIVGNFEASIPTKHIKTPNYNFQFSVNKDYLRGLTEAGFTHLSLANNHAFDYGRDGYNNAKKVLSENFLVPFGEPDSFGEDTVSYLSASNTTYALIGLNETQMDINPITLNPVLKEASENSDVQIVYIHWGPEYQHEPSKEQRLIAKSLSEAGVDIIIGHHPHVIQSIEKVNDTLVFYSLGNYVFDQYFSREVMEGLAVRLTRVGDNLKVTLMPHSSRESKAQPRLIEGESKVAILTEIAKYSDKNMHEMIITGEVLTPMPLATSTEIAIMNP